MYAQLIAMDAASFESYKENQDVMDLALKVNSKAGRAIKIVKTTAQANVQNADQEAQQRDKTVRVRSDLRPDVPNIDATLIKFRKWIGTLIAYVGSKPSTSNTSSTQSYEDVLPSNAAQTQLSGRLRGL